MAKKGIPTNQSTRPHRTTKPGPAKKKKHKVINWHDYNEALKQRGNIEVWVEKGLAEVWVEVPGESKKRGAQKKYSDLAITTTLQFGAIFHQRLRQTEGFVTGIFHLIRLELPIPDYSTLSRRSTGVVCALPVQERDSVVAIMDSTGLKVYGEGEWKVRQHGYGKHRTWRKFHLDVTPDGEIRAVELTGNEVADSAVVKHLLNQETATVTGLVGDGGYDKRAVYAVCQERQITDVRIPPQHNAKIWLHGNTQAPPHPRDQNLREIRQTTRKKWKERLGYHVRSLSENIFFRYKTIFGDRLSARKFPNQVTEVVIKAGILNRMRRLGMPQTVVVA